MELSFTVTPNELKERLKKLVQLEEPPAVFLWGQPGIGKTQVVYQVGEELGLETKVMVLSLMDPTELKGFFFPNRETGSVEIFPLSFPREKFVLFFDEFNTAPVAVQNAALRIVLEKKIGDYALPRGTLIICSGNRAKDKVNVSKLSSAMVNRAVHYLVMPDFNDFKEYWFARKLPMEVVAYLEMYQSDLCHEPSIDMPFPTPRTWEMVGRIGDWKDLPTLCGLLGNEVGLKFSKFVENAFGIDELLNMVLQGKRVYPKKDEVEKSYMLVLALTEKADRSNLKVMLEYILNAPDDFAPFAICLLWNLRLKGIPAKEFMNRENKPLTMALSKKHPFVFEHI